jgi:WD40 repeat protein
VATLGGHADDVVGCDVAPGPDGWVATGSDDGSVRFWDPRRWDAPVATADLRSTEVKRVRFAPARDRGGRQRLVAGCGDGVARVMTARRDRGTVSTDAELRGATETTFDAAFAPDGRGVVTASHDGAWRAYELPREWWP